MVKFSVHKLLRSLALVAGVSAAAAGHASDFPNKPIRIVVGFGPGVGMEVSTRLLADELSKELGQSVIVENKPGAATMIAATSVAQAAPDGYTLLMLNNQTINNELMYSNVPYKRSDFIPVAAGGKASMVMAVSKTVPVSTGREFIDYAKARPGELFYAHWGAGGSPHVLAARLQAMTGIQMDGVAYKSSGQASTDIASGRVHLFFTSVTHGMSLHNAGHLKIVAVSTPDRMQNLPDVPTYVESGIEGIPQPWWGYGVPAGTPREVVDKLAAAIRKAVKSPRYLAMLETTGSTLIDAETPEEFDKFIDSSFAEWAAAIRPLNLKLD